MLLDDRNLGYKLSVCKYFCSLSVDQGCSNVFNSGPNFTFAYIYWAITKKATSGSVCCETGMWLADRGEQS